MRPIYAALAVSAALSAADVNPVSADLTYALVRTSILYDNGTVYDTLKPSPLTMTGKMTTDGSNVTQNLTVCPAGSPCQSFTATEHLVQVTGYSVILDRSGTQHSLTTLRLDLAGTVQTFTVIPGQWAEVDEWAFRGDMAAATKAAAAGLAEAPIGAVAAAVLKPLAK